MEWLLEKAPLEDLQATKGRFIDKNNHQPDSEFVLAIVSM